MKPLIKARLVITMAVSAFSAAALMASGAYQDRVHSVPSLEAKQITTTDAFVVGLDAKIRTCPADANVYVMVDHKGQVDKNLYYVPPKQMLMSNPQITYSIVCIKVEK